MLFEVRRLRFIPDLFCIWNQRACFCKGRRPGVARRASNFLSRRRKKVTKERATLLSATPSLRYGASWGARSRGAPWNSLCAARAAQTATASQLTKHARSDARATPRPARPRRIQKGTGGADIHTGHCFARPRLAGASATRCANWAEHSDGPCGCSAGGCLAPHPCWLRLRRGGCGVAWASERPCFVN